MGMGCGAFPEAKDYLTSTSDLASSTSGSWAVSQLLLQLKVNAGDLW